jgi:hypothetical protein
MHRIIRPWAVLGYVPTRKVGVSTVEGIVLKEGLDYYRVGDYSNEI